MTRTDGTFFEPVGEELYVDAIKSERSTFNKKLIAFCAMNFIHELLVF